MWLESHQIRLKFRGVNAHEKKKLEKHFRKKHAAPTVPACLRVILQLAAKLVSQPLSSVRVKPLCTEGAPQRNEKNKDLCTHTRKACTHTKRHKHTHRHKHTDTHTHKQKQPHTAKQTRSFVENRQWGSPNGYTPQLTSYPHHTKCAQPQILFWSCIRKLHAFWSVRSRHRKLRLWLAISPRCSLIAKGTVRTYSNCVEC